MDNIDEVAMWERRAREKAMEDLFELAHPGRGQTIKSPAPFLLYDKDRMIACQKAYVDEILTRVDQEEYFKQAWDAEKMLVNQLRGQLSGPALVRMVQDKSLADFVACFRGIWGNGRKTECPSTMSQINAIFQDTQSDYTRISGITKALTGMRMLGQLAGEKPHPFLIQDQDGINSVDARLRFFLTRCEQRAEPVVNMILKAEDVSEDLVALWLACVEHLHENNESENKVRREKKFANIAQVGNHLAENYPRHMVVAVGKITEEIRDMLRHEVKPGPILALVNAISLSRKTNMGPEEAIPPARPKM